MAITHHGELEGLTAGTERLVAVAQADENCRGKLYKVYLDSQVSLKVVDAMRSTADQGRLKRVQNACESIRRRGAELKLHWVAGHAGVSRNEAANEVANKTHDTVLSPPEHRRCEVTARLVLINLQARQAWRKTWKEGLNATHYRSLALEIIVRHMHLHRGRKKPHSALLTQL